MMMFLSIFELDLRAVGLFRLCLGAYAVMDLLVRIWMGMEWYVSSDLYPWDARVLVADTPHKALFHQYVFFYNCEGIYFL